MDPNRVPRRRPDDVVTGLDSILVGDGLGNWLLLLSYS
jgi:hypothetical protein